MSTIEIKSWRPLSQDWVPSKPLYRDEQLDDINFGLSIPDNHLFLYGMKGLGKTMITRIISSEFEKHGKVLFIPCGRTVHGTFKNFVPSDVKYGDHLASLARKEELLIIFDDVSSMFQKRTISSWLHDIHDAAERAKTTFNLHIMVTSTIPLMVYLNRGYMEDFTQSRMGFKTVTFKQYAANEIQGILSQRVKAALKDVESVDDDALEFLAGKVARLGSDMRFATRVLKGAISCAIRDGSKVTREVMHEAYRYEWRDFYRSQYLSMPPHKAFLLHTVFYLLHSHATKSCTSTEAYRIYTTLCDKNKVRPMRERMLRIYLDELQDERFIDLERAVTGHGRVTHISSTFDPTEMVSAVENMDWREILR